MGKSKLSFFLLLISFLCVEAKSQDLAIVLSPGDDNAVIRGTLNGNTTSFSRAITLTLTGGDAKDVRVVTIVKSDLVNSGDPQVVIDRKDILIPAVSLRKDQPQDVVITVNNVTRFGTYKGTLKFWLLPEQTESQARVVNLTVEISPKIDVKAPNALSAQLARCSPLPCTLAFWLPASIRGEKRGLQLDNATPDAVSVPRYGMTLRGEKTGRLVTEQDVPINVPNQMLGAGQSTPVEISFPDRNKLPPDRYVGSMRFDLKGTDIQPAVNFTLDVRDGPWWALVALVIGVVAGRLIKNMNSPEALLQLKLMPRYYELHNRIKDLNDDKARKSLFLELADIKRRIDAARETEAVLTQDLEKLDSRINLFNRLDQLQGEIVSRTVDPVRAELLGKIEIAREALRLPDVERSLIIIKEITARLQQIEITAPDDDSKNSMRNLTALALEVSDESASAAVVHRLAKPSEPGAGARVLATLAGVNFMSAEARYWFWRPLFYLLLLVLLVLLGLKTLYLDSGSTFGSEGIYDYFGLFMWGLSADVVQRTLQTLQLPRA